MPPAIPNKYIVVVLILLLPLASYGQKTGDAILVDTLAGECKNLTELLQRLTSERCTYSTAWIKVLSLAEEKRSSFVDDVVKVSLFYPS